MLLRKDILVIFMNDKSYNIGFITEDHVELYDSNLLTDEQKSLIDYARSFGCKWIAKDYSDGETYVFRNKPILINNCYITAWFPTDITDSMYIHLKHDFSLLTGEEIYPLYIGDDIYGEVK